MKIMKNISLPISKELTCDVLVVGGGVSGLSAAVNAAREGADTILCESAGYLGGIATKGLVGPFMTCYDKQGKTQIIRGFFSEFVEAMVAEGGAISYRDCPGSDSFSGYRVNGHIGVTPFDPECLKRTAERFCLSSGVKLCYHMMLIAAETDERCIRTAYFAAVEGIVAIHARVFIDTTGTSQLAYLAGARTFRGDEEGTVQTSSLFFRIGGVNKAMLDEHMKSTDDVRTRFYMDEIENGRLAGVFPCGTRKLRIFEAPEDIWTVNMAQEDEEVNELDSEAVTAAEISQRRQIPEIVAFLKKTVPALSDIYLIDTADELGVRESRRIVGKRLFTKQDIENHTHFTDAIAVCANSMDIHQKNRVNYTAYKSDENYYIPLSSLQSADIDNLLTAGKSLYADKHAFAAVRVIPPCFAMGEAVGIEAALAVKQNKLPGDIPADKVQERILAHGGYLG